MRCSCYEIGGDVFSLAELETYVLRGNMSRAIGAKSPFVVAPKGSREHKMYALEHSDARLNLILVRSMKTVFACLFIKNYPINLRHKESRFTCRLSLGPGAQARNS